MNNEFEEEKRPDDSPRQSGKYGILGTLAAFAALAVFAVLVIVPFVYMVLISLKTPSEIGNGRLVPDGLRDLARIGNRSLAWVRVELTDEQSAALNGIDLVPILPSTIVSTRTAALKRLPSGIVSGVKISMEKPRLDAPVVYELLETQDPENAIQQMDKVTVFCPGPQEDTWVMVEGTIVQRNAATLVGRLLANYRSLLNTDALANDGIMQWLARGYPRWFLNSLLVAFATVILGVFLDSLAAFAFAKYDFPFRRLLFGVLLATIMIPYPVTLVPSFFIFAKLGLYNTYAALIIPGMVSAFGIFLVRQYLQGVPDDMIDAARVDGASDFRVYRHIILPIARPVLAALAVFRFIWQWNTYLFPLVLTNRDSMKTVQLGLATIQNAYGRIDPGIQMAGATLAVIPILVVYAFMQKHFIAGITLGSVKD